MPTMTAELVLDDIESRIQAGYPLLFLRTWEEARWESLLAELALEIERGIVVWSATTGWQPALSESAGKSPSAIAALSDLERYPVDHVFLFKDFHPHLSDAEVLRRLRDLALVLPERRQTILFLDPVAKVPMELAKDALAIELPLPTYDDFRAALDDFLAETVSSEVELSAQQQDWLIKGVMGLTLKEALKAWTRALHGQTSLTDTALAGLVSEKRALASASEFLEFYDLDTGVDDVGGLDELKEWLRRRVKAYSPEAREQGIPLPKGAMLLGVQGCGKSLTARATARLLAFPLIRLDIANLLSGSRGGSERNLREVLDLVDSIAPAVLWLDEMEKGFAGAGGDTFSDSTMARLVGSFLLWMQEQAKPVFVIATANSIANLPPEMLRRGRFDELFFIDLPNFHERKHILTIHLSKRNWKPERFNLDLLAEKTDGYSGAELEQLVAAALIDAFGRGVVLTDDDLDRSRRQLVPLSVTMEDKIFALRQWAQDRCRRATSDNRVTQMLDAEVRSEPVAAPIDDDAPPPAWSTLAEAGQIKAALVEYVRQGGDILFPQVQAAFEPYLNVHGEQGLALKTNPNTVLWLGMSSELCVAIIELVTARRLYIHCMDPETYQRFKAPGLKLPPIAAPAEEKLPRPVWLPSSLRTGPHPVHAAKLARIGRIQLANR